MVRHTDDPFALLVEARRALADPDREEGESRAPEPSPADPDDADDEEGQR